MTCLAVLALVLGGCSGEEKTSTDSGKSGSTLKDAGKTTGDAMKDAGDAAGDTMNTAGAAAEGAASEAGSAATRTMTFECASPSCTKTKEGTMADPPS